MLSFFGVLVRFSVLVAVLPFLGDRFIPVPVKVLLSLAITISLFPMLVSSGQIHVGEAFVWGRSAGGIVSTIALEALVGLVLGYTAKLSFDSINFGSNMIGTFMGFASASTYDPHQESNTQIIAELHLAIAMLIFLSLDGHHLMLRASLDSYRIVGLGKAGISVLFTTKLTDLTAQVIQFGIQLTAPIAISMFAVNIVFGLVSKAMPQLNILVLSFAISAFIGFVVLFLSVPQFQTVAGNILERMGDSMETMLKTLAEGGK